MKDLQLSDISSDFPVWDLRRFLRHQCQEACNFLSILDAILDRIRFKNPSKFKPNSKIKNPKNPLLLLDYYPRHASSTLSFSPFWLIFLVCKPTDFREQVHDQPYRGQVGALLTQLNASSQQQTHVRTRIYFFFFICWIMGLHTNENLDKKLRY